MSCHREVLDRDSKPSRRIRRFSPRFGHPSGPRTIVSVGRRAVAFDHGRDPQVHNEEEQPLCFGQ